MTTSICARITLLICALLLVACDKGVAAGGGGGSASPGEGPPKPTYENAFQELDDLPEQLSAQVRWAAQPIDDVATLGNEIGALRASLKIDAAAFESMCKVAFTDGKIEVGAQADLAEHKAEIEAVLGKIKQVGVDLKGIPARVKVAGKNMGKLTLSAPKLALKATSELKGEISTASGDQKVQLEANLKTVSTLPNQVKTEAVKLKNDLAALPKKALGATQNMLAAFAGKPMPNAAEAGAAGGAAVGGEPTPAAATPAPPSPGAGTTPPAPPAPAPAPAPAPTAVPPTPTQPAVAAAARPAVGHAPPPPPPSAATASGPGRAARIAMLVKQAKDCAGRGDHLSAADAYKEAYLLDRTDYAMAFEIGHSAWRAKDCKRAMSYLEFFTQNADKAKYEAQFGQTTGILRELKTFDCPVRTLEDEQAYAQTLTARAQALGEVGDWGGAAALYAEAYQKVPTDHSFAYHVAVASWEAHECGDAKTYLEHFTNVGDQRKHRRELKDTKKRLDTLSGGGCPAWAPAQKDAHARELFAQAQDLERKLDFGGAVDKYERAYLLLPTNHAFAWRIAEAAWNGYDCETSDKYLRQFVASATDPKLAPDVERANGFIARIDSVGCPNALWSEGGAAAPGTGGGAAADMPPPSGAQGGAKSSSCAVADDAGASGWWALLGVWLVVGKRRRLTLA